MANEFPTIPGFRITALLESGSKSQVYSAVRLTDQSAFVLKFPTLSHPPLNLLAQYRNQFQLTRGLDSNRFCVPLALETFASRFVLILPDDESLDLEKYIGRQPQGRLDIEEFFTIAIQICDSLAALQQAHIIHKDIKPANILIQPQTLRIRLTDFGISTHLPRESQGLAAPKELEGSLPYMAPEQTGRMNRGIDYRSDFYALGISFFQMLTGELPFKEAEAVALVYCHLAMPLPDVRNMRPEAPETLQKILQKLTAKNAEDRYQSAEGIRADVMRCQQAWSSGQDCPPFALGQQDFSGHFHIPEKLYGRQKEVHRLLDAFARTSIGKAELLLVSGVSGIGKTVLVNEIHKPITGQQGFFLSGKFDQFRRDIPFAGLAQALNGFFDQLHGEAPDLQHQMQLALQEKLGDEGRALVTLIPRLREWVRPGEMPPELHGNAATLRAERLFRDLFQAICGRDHPMVLFLDDLQWVDSATLAFLPLLLQSQSLLLVGAYRDKEVGQGHPLAVAIDSLTQEFPNAIAKLHLQPLALDSLEELVQDALGEAKGEQAGKAHGLAEIVLANTTGNPFYAHQFLNLLADEGFLRYDQSDGGWRFDLEEVRQLAVGGDVVEFMQKQLHRYDSITRSLLGWAACLGNRFLLNQLAALTGFSAEACVNQLWPVIQKGQILPLDQTFRVLGHEDKSETTTSYPQPSLSVPEIAYRFSHDRIQEAAYRLLNENELAQRHLAIGKLLYQQFVAENQGIDNRNLANDPEANSLFFDCVNHWNQGIALITDVAERTKLRECNQLAAERAKGAVAFQAALHYANTAIHLLPPDAWESQYPNCLQLHELAADVAYLHGDALEQEKFSAELLRHSNHLLDCISIHRLNILALDRNGDYQGAMAYARPILAELGYPLPTHLSDKEQEVLFASTQAQLELHPFERLLELPQMEDRAAAAVQQLFFDLFNATMVVQPELLGYMSCTAVQLSLEKGIAPVSPAFITMHSYFLAIFEQFQAASQLTDIALALVARNETRYFDVTVITSAYCSPKIWVAPLRDALVPLHRGFQLGMEQGDYANSSACAMWNYWYGFYAGQDLAQLQQRLGHYQQAIADMQRATELRTTRFFRQVLDNLASEREAPVALSGEWFREEVEFPKMAENQESFYLTVYYLQKAILAYWFHDFHLAMHCLQRAEPHKAAAAGSFHIAMFCFYDSLIQIALYGKAGEGEKAQMLERVIANQDQLLRYQEHAPMNIQHKWELVQAERFRVMQDWLSAQNHYELAILHAKQYGFLQEEAMANELACRFYLDWNKPKLAQVYWQDAWYGYAQWGAKAKVLDLDKHYRDFWQEKERRGVSSCPTPSTTIGRIPSDSSGTSIHYVLDLKSIIKATQALSGERTLAGLLDQMFNLMMENAGARRGLLILQQQGQWFIAGECQLDQRSRTILPKMPLLEFKRVPQNLIRQVIQTQRTQVLDNAADPLQPFAKDPWFMAHQELKSVLCMPILSKGALLGLLYLENDLATDVFALRRQEMLQILAGQMAISIENALLYEELEEKVRQRTEELRQVQDELVKTAREAGMSEIAQGVMHNIGNAITPLKSSAQMAQKSLHESLLRSHLAKAIEPLFGAIEGSTNLEPQQKERMIQILKRLPQGINDEFQAVEDQLGKMGERIRHIEAVIQLQNKYVRKTDLKEPMNLNLLVQDALEMLGDSLAKHAIAVETHLGELPQYYVEKHNLLQVLINLIKNANESMEEMSPEQRKLIIATDVNVDEAGKYWIRIVVKDNGKGFDEQQQKRLFSFGFTTKEKGTGVGLHASANYLIAQGGRIEASSEGAGKGAVFSIWLPAVT